MRRFTFRLALALGMTRAEMMQKMSSKELSEWLAFDSIEPIGELRADLRSGIIASTIANVNRGKRSRTFKPSDFMPCLRVERRKQSRSEVVAVLQRIAVAHGAQRGT